MFTACFDASGHPRDPRTPFLVVAGFLSTADAWRQFDGRWRKRLALDGLTYFHTVDLTHNKNEFKNGWRNNEVRKNALRANLIEIIRANTFRLVGAIVVNKDVNVLSRNQQRDWHINAYSFACGICIAKCFNWVAREKMFTPVRLYF